MSQELYKKESELLALLPRWENQASSSRLALDEAEQELVAIKTDLNDVREKLLKALLDERLVTGLGFAYVLKTDLVTGEYLLSVISTPGAELEFDKFVSSIKWEDTNNIPLDHILRYLGVGLPWSSQSSAAYV